MSDRPRDTYPDPRDLVIRCYLRLPGDPPPDLSAFSDPITIPCQIVRQSASPAISEGARGMGSSSPSPTPTDRTAGGQQSPASDGSLRLITATGTTLAVGDAAHLSRIAWCVFASIPKGHPVLLAAAGSILAFATAAALVEHLVAMTGDRNAGMPGPPCCHASS